MNNNKYVTASLALAAAIQLASQSKLLAIDRTSVKKSSFVFNETPDLSEIIRKFWAKELLLDVFSYFETLRYIKARLYQGDEE